MLQGQDSFRASFARIWYQLTDGWSLFTLRNAVFAIVVGSAIGLMSLYSVWLSLAGVVVGVFVLAALSQPMLLAYTMIAATLFTSGMSRGQLVPLLRPNEAVLVFVVTLSAPVILFSRRRIISSLRTVDAAIAIFVIGTALLPAAIYLMRGVTLNIDDVMALVAPLQYVLLYLVFQFLPTSEADRRKIIHLMLISGSVVAVIGLLQAAGIQFVVNFLQEWYPSSHLSDAEEYGRVTSIVAGWNVFGILMMINLLIVRSLFINDVELSRLEKINVWMTIVLCGAALLASGSFAGIIGLGIGMLIIGHFDQQNFQRIILIGIALAIAAVLLRPLLAERLEFQFDDATSSSIVPQTLRYRFQLWELIFLPAVREHGLFGLRPDFGQVVDWGFAESQYFYLLLRSGVVSLVGHLLWVGLLLVWLHRRLMENRGFARSVALSTFSIIIVLSIAGLTNAVFSFSGAIDYLWILLGVLASQERIA